MTSAAKLTTELIVSRDKFAACAAEWSGLFETAANPMPWWRHGWLLLAWRPSARAVLVRDGGRLVMAAVFVLGLRRLRPIAQFLRAPIPQTDDVLYVETARTAEHADRLLAALSDSLWLPRQLRVTRLPEASPLRLAAERAGRSLGVRERFASYHVPTDAFPDFPAYLHARGKHLRLDHGRRLRRLGESGNVELRRERGLDAAPTLRWLLTHKRQWLDHTRKVAPWLRSGAVDKFLAQLQHVPDAPSSSIWSLRVDDAIVAALLVFEEDRLWVSHIIARNTEFDNASPGRTLNLLTIERAYAEGVARIELGISGDDWKHRLAISSDVVVSERFRLK